MTTEQLSALENQLREKEQLVAALTERLEQAAEQLDRIRRNGGDRGLRIGGGGVPPELIEEQRSLVAELQQAVQQWVEMQPGAALGRIEVQITELRDFVAGKGWDGVAAGHGDLERSSASDAADARRSKASATGPKEPGVSAYEAMKAQLLDSPSDESNESKEKTSPAMIAGPPVSLEEIAPVDPPEVIDPQAAGIDELRKAVEQRDLYISYLTRWLRAVEMSYQSTIDWSLLNNAPDDLRRRLEELERMLHATLRHAEVDHSLERARLSREATRLEQLEDQIRREMKRLNMSEPGDDDDRADDPHQPAKGMNNRWQRLFGKK